MYNFGNRIFSHDLKQDTALGVAQLQAVPSFTLQLVNQMPVAVRYRSPLAFDDVYPGGSFPHEVTLDLFVRDPTEYEQTLLSQVFTLPDPWVEEMSAPRGYPQGETAWMREPWHLPNAVQLSYRGPYPTQYTSFNVSPSLFWAANIQPSPTSAVFPTSSSAWGLPGSLPIGSGSIKAIRAVSHSICEAEVPLQDMLNEIKIAVPREINHNCGAYVDPLGRVTRSHLDTLSVSTYLRRGEDPRTHRSYLAGGFLLWGQVFVSVAIPLVLYYPRCTADFIWDYQLMLDDGFLTVSGGPLGGSPLTNGDSSVCDRLGPQITDAFTMNLPKRISDVARARQRYRAGPCDETGDVDPLTGKQKKSCRRAADNMKNIMVIPGLDVLFGSTPPPQLAANIQLALDDGADNPDGSRNWECVPVRRPRPLPSSSSPSCMDDEPTDFACDFLLRAKSLTANPDSVDLVWFDTLLDVWPCNGGNCAYPHAGAYPGIVMFLAALAGNRLGDLCSRPMFSGDIERYFATVHQDQVTCKQSLGGKPDVCCTSDADCMSPDVKCDLTLHRCAGTKCGSCAAFQRCDANSGLCVTPNPGCDPRDPFGTTCPAGMVCEQVFPIRPWFGSQPRNECRVR